MSVRNTELSLDSAELKTFYLAELIDVIRRARDGLRLI